MMEFKLMLVELARGIRDADLERMKFLCSGYIPKGHQEEIKNAVQLWDALTEQDLIGENNCTLLKQMLYSRKDLLRIIDAFEQRVSGQPIVYPSSRDLAKNFDIVADNINIKNWRKLARHLEVNDNDIDDIAERHHGNVREQIRSCLVLWSERSESASRETLVEALKACQMNLTAQKIMDSG